jgi:hypothetical protein
VPFLLLSAFLFIAVLPTMADTTSFEILPQQQRAFSFDLSSGDSSSGTMVTNGALTVDFWITDALNNNVTAYSSTGSADFSFEAHTSGTFQFHIFNRNSQTVQGTLNYDIVHRIFGIPQEMFLLLLIVGIVLLMLIIWGLMSKA